MYGSVYKYKQYKHLTIQTSIESNIGSNMSIYGSSK